MTDLLALTEELCAIPSVSGDEATIADDIEARLRRDAPKLDVARVGANVIARTASGSSVASCSAGTSTRCRRTAMPRRAATATCCTVSAPPT